MKDGRKYVEPGDLVGIAQSRHSQIIAGIAKDWTDVSFQYFRITNYSTRKYQRKSDKSLEDYKNYIQGDRFYPSIRTDYIRSRVEKRVVPIKKNYLNDYEKVYYKELKKKLNS